MMSVRAKVRKCESAKLSFPDHVPGILAEYLVNVDEFFRRAARAKTFLGKQVITSKMKVVGALRTPEFVWESK